MNFSSQILDCVGPLKPEVVESTALNSFFPASNVLVLGEEDTFSNGKYNYWLAQREKTTGQGFTLKVDTCNRQIAGFQIKNLGGESDTIWATKEFKVSGSKKENGPWEALVQEQLIETRDKVSSLLNFTFEKPVEIQFLKFELISFWDSNGGGLQYFAAILATSRKHKSI